MLQIRPTSGDRRFYSPNRDLAYCFPNLFKIALKELIDDSSWINHSWWSDYLKFHSVSVEDIQEAAVAMMLSFQYFSDKDCDSPAAALVKADFFNTKPAAQLAIAARLGQVCTGAFFTSLRDIMRDDDELPTSLKEIVTEGHKLSKSLVQHIAVLNSDN